MDKNFELITNFITKSNDSICFLNVHSKLMEKLALELYESYRIIDLKSEYTPLKPFLKVLSDSQISEDVVESHAYPLHKKIFADFFKTGVCEERKDIILELEYFYETSRLKKSVLDMILNTQVNEYIFLNAQCLKAESLDIIEMLEKSCFNGKFIFCFDALDNEFYSDYTKKFIEKITGHRNFLNIPVTEKELIELNVKRNELKSVNEDSLYSTLNDFDEIHTALRNYRLFISFEESKNLATWVSNNLQRMKFTASQKRSLQLEIAKILFDNDMLDEAAIPLNTILDSNIKDFTEVEALFYLGKIFARKKSNQTAYKYVLMIKDKLSSKKDNYLYALALNMEYHVTLCKDDEASERTYEATCELLKQAGLTNNYICTSLNIPWTTIDSPEKQKRLHDRLDYLMDCARGIDNLHLVSSIYHRKAIILSHYGRRAEALQYNKECNKIRTEIGEIQPILAIRNGISYESLNNSDYVEAYNTINSIIPNIFNLNDYSTIVDTLKNITYAVFFTRNFAQADQMLDLIIYLLNMFNLANAANNSYLPSMNDLLIYKSMICIENGDYIHAQLNYLEITSNGKLTSSYDKPFLNYIKAACLVDEKNIDQSVEVFNEGIEDFTTNCPSQSHKVAFMYFQFAKLLFDKQEFALSDKFLHLGSSLAWEKELSYYTKHSAEVTLKDYLMGVERIEPLSISVQFLKEKAEKDRLLNQLHSKIYDYQFLNMVKSFNGITESIKKYLEKTISAIYDYIGCKNIYIAENVDQVWKKVYAVNRGETPKFASLNWRSLYAQSSPDAQLIHHPEHSLYYANISKFDFKFAVIIIPSEKQLYSYDKLNMLNIVLSSIQAEIVMLKQKENLLFMSTTDQLSMLKNRRALEEHISIECEKIHRIHLRKKIVLVETVAFIDLDNFKFYNDTFGHEAGDLIIQEFARLLKKTLRCVDFTARYGGDEFVLVLPDTNVQEAYRAGERIREGLNKAEYFIPKLEKLLKRKNIQIPEKNRIGFSMGLCSNLNIENFYDLHQVMKNADSALYYCKEHGKCMSIDWQTVQDGKAVTQ